MPAPTAFYVSGQTTRKGTTAFSSSSKKGTKYSDYKIGITYEGFDYSLLKKACLTENEIVLYCKPRIYDDWDYYDMDIYAWHIGNLVIFDKPKELSEFRTVNKTGIPQYEFGVGTCDYKKLTKAPQSFMFIEVEE